LIAGLEGVDEKSGGGGGGGLAFASGMAAENAVLQALLAPGEHVIAVSDVYGGTHRLFHRVYEPRGCAFTHLDSFTEKEIGRAMRPETKLVWVESPTNPLLRIIDIAAAAKAAHAHGALLVVDNTFASPYLQQPFELGADIVIHSATKYLGGHSDLVLGLLVARDREVLGKLRAVQNAAGAVPGPFDCWLTVRGIRTLAVRMERQCASAGAVAAFLAAHQKVARVHFPGLPAHPGHELAKKQMRRFGGMVSFELKGTLEETKRFVTRTELFVLAVSLGGVESLIEHPATMSHASIPAKARAAAGLPDGLIRLSIGLESAGDLIADLERALEGI